MFTLFTPSILKAQIFFDAGILRIENKVDGSKIDSYLRDSVFHIIFSGSNLDALDSSWLGIDNLKLISFTKNAQVPENMSFLNKAESLHFSSYESEIIFPYDFPFNSYIHLGLSNIPSVPKEIIKFFKLESLNLYMLRNNESMEKIAKVRTLKELSICEVHDFDLKPLCELMNLENLELASLSLESSTLDFTCFKSLNFIRIENTNMKGFKAKDASNLKITLEYNNLSKDETKSILSEYRSAHIIIKN